MPKKQKGKKSKKDDSDSLGSDFGECVQEHKVDSDGNIIPSDGDDYGQQDLGEFEEAASYGNENDNEQIDMSGASDNDYGSDDDDDDDDSDDEAIAKSSAKLKKPAAKSDKKQQSADDAALEERRKKKRIEKLDKRIKLLQKVDAKERKVVREDISSIRNKQKRHEVVGRKRAATQRERDLDRLQRKKIREEKGEDAAPKGKVNTIESMRVKDETIIDDADDEDIKGEHDIDEFSSYFKSNKPPKILMTTNRRPKGKIFDFLKEVKLAFPGTEYYERKNFLIKDIIEWAKEREFTDIMVFYEKNGIPHSLILSHLPDGPTATFRVSGVKLRSKIVNHGAAGDQTQPELILNNFDTMLGHRVGRMLASMFPQVPNFQHRRVITFHNQRDFMFFRHHRYEFNENGSRAALSEIGPRFTLKLHSLQLGTLNSKSGEFEFVYKPRDGVNRKKFFL